MIERWHRSLKAAIRCHENKNWLEVLPTVMLGLRNSYKEDLQATAAEMLYGTPLRLPGEFFVETNTNFNITKFKDHMQTIRPRPTRHHSRRSYFIFFVRVDHVKQPLEQPYEGPYRVLKHILDNLFLIDYKGKETTISTERLKPAYIELHEEKQHQTYRHYGFNKTYFKIKERYWGTKKKDIRSYVRACSSCQINKTNFKSTKQPMEITTIADQPKNSKNCL
ncbi:uncharacterized protein LOC122536449 [Frieseomelitta varia]|uniref:uncharacterized protein LOC122536449 n=1 Tax=Frieseomelitta varia TaxID=561572 RepID=UPI001CB6987E|nr:uncharacterized protein LOC122536449 [Frieseomelitta varia]